MSRDDGSNALIRGSRLAIARAKGRGGEEVTSEDLLAGMLHASARFGVAILGSLTVDLEELGEPTLEETDAAGPKVAYSDEAVALFDEAARVARLDGCPKIEPVHMLVAFAREENGLMGRIKRRYGLDAAGWRAALARWSSVEKGRSAAAPSAQELMSPDEAAEFLGVHTQTVRGYIRAGKLPAHRLAGERAIRIRRQDLLGLLEPYEPE